MSHIQVYQDGILVADSSVGGPIPTPTPVPVPIPVPTPPRPVPGNVTMHSKFPANRGTTVPFTSQLGAIHSFPLPGSSGLVSNVELPGQPRISLEWSISKVPGDFDYYKTDAAMVVSARGTKRVVCGCTADSESGGIKWNQSEGCVVPAGEQWYINLRFVAGIPPGVDSTIMVGLAL
jgi:hypothetical protein